WKGINMDTVSWTDPAYEKVAKLMEAKTGMVFRSHRITDLEAVTNRSMDRLQLKDIRHFLQKLETERADLDDLTAQLTIGESYFFREPAQFQWIKEKILPEILQRL